MQTAEFYHELAEMMLMEKYGLYRLEERFIESGKGFLPGRTGRAAKFFSLCNLPRLERLTEEERDALQVFADHAEAVEDADGSGEPESSGANPSGWYEDAFAFVANTWKKVLPPSTDPDVQVQFFDDIYNRGTFPGNSLVFVFMDRVPEDTDVERENRKSDVFASVKQQFEELADSKEEDIRVRIVRR